MSKLGKVSEETQELVDKIISEIGYENYMNIDVVSSKKEKTLIKINRANAYAEYIGRPETVVITVYESAFERLSERQQELLMRDAINSIVYDTEKDKIVIGCPQIVVSCGGRAQWGDEIINAAECGVMAIQQIIDEEKERKELEKALKKNKKSKIY